MNNLKIYDKLLCLNTINNCFGQILYEKDKEYNVLYIDNDFIVINHPLYRNEYVETTIDFVKENFVKI
jgi:hypothetical protein